MEREEHPGLLVFQVLRLQIGGIMARHVGDCAVASTVVVPEAPGRVLCGFGRDIVLSWQLSGPPEVQPIGGWWGRRRVCPRASWHPDGGRRLDLVRVVAVRAGETRVASSPRSRLCLRVSVSIWHFSHSSRGTLDGFIITGFLVMPGWFCDQFAVLDLVTGTAFHSLPFRLRHQWISCSDAHLRFVLEFA